jgi:hypothetical protein
MDELKTIREKAANGKQKDAIIIPAGELERIRMSMNVPDPKENQKKLELEKTMQ